VGLLDVLLNDLNSIVDELPVLVTFQGQGFSAARSAYKRSNSLGDGGFFNDASMIITAAYAGIPQQIGLGDIVLIGARKFRVVSAELSQDAVSVDFTLEDINK